MEYKGTGKATISGKKHYDREKALEPFREIVKAKMDAANSGKEAPGASRITPQDDFLLQGDPGLITLIKWLIKLSPPPAPRERGPEDGRSGPEELSKTTPELTGPDPIEPSSSAWIIWLTIIILAAVYFFRAVN